MIHLLSIAKSFSKSGHPPNVLFRPTSLSLPADRRVVVLGQRRGGKSVFLRMLAGAESPDQGKVIVPVRLSPVINSGGLLQPQLTVFENIRFLARVFGVHADRLAATVDALCGIGTLVYRPVKTQDTNQRKALEAAVTIALPFDCYLIDNLGQMAPEMLELSFETAARRNAGAIFATSQPRLARQFANFAVVISDQSLHPFSHVEEAVGFYERYARE